MNSRKADSKCLHATMHVEDASPLDVSSLHPYFVTAWQHALPIILVTRHSISAHSSLHRGSASSITGHADLKKAVEVAPLALLGLDLIQEALLLALLRSSHGKRTHDTRGRTLRARRSGPVKAQTRTPYMAILEQVRKVWLWGCSTPDGEQFFRSQARTGSGMGCPPHLRNRVWV